MIGHGIEYFGSAVRHNFNFANRRAFVLARTIGEIEINQQCRYYATDLDNLTCQCGISIYLSKVFRQFIPCCHLVHLGAARGRITELPILVQDNNSTGCCLELDMVTRSGPQPSRERKDALLDIAARSVKHLSKTGVKLEDVAKWVRENCPLHGENVEYVQNIPVPILELICAGVLNYIKKDVPKRDILDIS
jgi:hypothetical protein